MPGPRPPQPAGPSSGGKASEVAFPPPGPRPPQPAGPPTNGKSPEAVFPPPRPTPPEPADPPTGGKLPEAVSPPPDPRPPTPAVPAPQGPTVSTTGRHTAPAPTPPVPPPPTPAPPSAGRVGAGAGVEAPVRLAGPGYVGSGPPTYDPEPTALPAVDPDGLDELVPDTVLDGARQGTCTLRAVSMRGDSARYRGEPRRDALLTARFGAGEQSLVLVAMATGARATPRAHHAAAELCRWIGRAVGRSHARLVEDIRAGRRGDLKSGLHRLTDRSLGRLRGAAVEQGLRPEEYAATLRCLLLPADPACRVRVFFGVGAGGLFRLRDGVWHDIEPPVTEVTGEPVVGFGSPPAETSEGDRLTMDLGIPTPPSPYDPRPEPPREPFRFRASVARPGDVLLMCTAGLAEPLRGEPGLPAHLTERWSRPQPPGLAAFLADTQVRVKGYADDRTAAAVWEA
ncbi:hypothetical protein SUDANB105_01582 [Streptomyces sp. enrichment culture]